MSIGEISVNGLSNFKEYSELNFFDSYDTIKDYYDSCKKDAIKFIFCKDMKNNLVAFAKVYNGKTTEIDKHIFVNNLWELEGVQFVYHKGEDDYYDRVIMKVEDDDVDLGNARITIKEENTENVITFLIKKPVMVIRL